MAKVKTLEEAQARVMELRKKPTGTRCPCCRQTVKLYRRKFTDEMATFMIGLYRAPADADGYVDINALGYRGGDYAKARYWGLVEQKPKDASDSVRRTSGYWRLTSLGRLFVQDGVAIPSHIFLYNKELEGFDKTVMVDISSVLELNGFNYRELMTAQTQGTNESRPTTPR